jgi:hypothetical protein
MCRQDAMRVPRGTSLAALEDQEITMSEREETRPGTERARDQTRKEGGARYGGGPWELADERGEQRYGRARNDESDPEAPDAAGDGVAAAEEDQERLEREAEKHEHGDRRNDVGP